MVSSANSTCSPRCRVLVWRRNDNICFAVLLGDSECVSLGERVSGAIKGILQVSTIGR